MPNDISLISIPVFSHKFAISLINEILVAKKEFDAYLINSAPLLDVLIVFTAFFNYWHIQRFKYFVCFFTII